MSNEGSTVRGVLLGFAAAVGALSLYQIITWHREKNLWQIYKDLAKEFPEEAKTDNA